MKKRERNIVYRRLIRSYLSSIISITLVLLLIGLAGLFAINTKAVSDYFKENIKVSLIFENSVEESYSKAVFSKLSSEKYINEARYISKEDGTEEMVEILGEDFLDVFEFNPIPISIDFKLKANYINIDSLAIIKSHMSGIDGVREVIYQESLMDIIANNMEKVAYVILSFIVILLIISIVLINNTIRLNLYSKRFIIYTMKLVGAKRSFIRKPLIARAVIQGVVSGIISISALYLILNIIKQDLPELFAIFDLKLIYLLFVSIFMIGIILCTFSTFFIVNRLVSMSKDDMYY
jgi:cell division transport system permease protein